MNCAESRNEIYPCAGICLTDSDTGCCLGCGRPPLSSGTPGSVAEPGHAPIDPEVADVMEQEKAQP